MPENAISRRDLARHLMGGTGVAIVGLSPVSANDDVAEKDNDQPDPVELQMAWLLARYPSKHLTDEQIDEIRSDVHRRHVQSGILRQYPLDHTDSPGLIFAAYRGDD